jgi:hypothetical protein
LGRLVAEARRARLGGLPRARPALHDSRRFGGFDISRGRMQSIEYIQNHGSKIALGAAVFCASLVLSIAAVIFVIVRLPPNYFHSKDPEPFWADRPPWQRFLGRAVKNLLGFALVALGLLMSLPGIPGQGLLTMFIGVVLLDFPGKRALERRIASIPAILRGINRLRTRFHRPPLTLDPAPRRRRHLRDAQKNEIETGGT